MGTLAPATMRVASMYFLSPGGTGNSASSGIWGMMSSGSSGSAKRGSRWISASFDRTMAYGTTATTAYCWLSEGDTEEAEVMSFSKWIKTRETQADTEVSEYKFP